MSAPPDHNARAIETPHPEDFARAIAQTADAVMITDSQGSLLYVNPGFETMTGYRATEVLGRPPSVLRSGAHDRAFYQHLWATICQGSAFHATFINRRKDGSLYHEEKTITPITDDDGAIVRYLSTGKDVSAHRAVEATNQNMQRFLDSVLENLPNMLFVKDADTLRFVRVNRAAEQLLGIERADLIGRSDYDFFPQAEADFFVAKDRAVLAGLTQIDIPEESIHTRAHGVRLLHTKKIPILDDSGKPRYLLGISDDITELRRTQDLSARLGHVLDQSSNEIYVFDAATLRFVSANAAAQRNIGYPLATLLTMHPFDIKPKFTRDRFEELLVPLRSGEAHSLVFDSIHERQDGSRYPIEVRLDFSRTEQPPVFVAVIQDITERRRTEERLEHLAHHDALTGLANRHLLMSELSRAMDAAAASNRIVAVMFLDLDRFKNINDTLGHHIGDGLLRAVAERLGGCLRTGDLVARMGGDEFTLVFAGVAHVDHVAGLARKVINQFTTPFRVAGYQLAISPSIGITLYPSDDTDIVTLMRNADLAMYAAKNRGGHTLEFYTPALNDRAARRLRLEEGLKLAVEREEFTLHYQPVMDLASGRVEGMEALLRWQHPELGLVPPSEFIPLAEETGLILRIGAWVLDRATRDAATWQAQGHDGLRVSVNLSSRQLRDETIVEAVTAALAKSGLNSAALTVELTESMLMEDMGRATSLLKILSTLGLSVSLDDFGTGYSSLSYLRHFPVHELKIDRSFVSDLPTSTFGVGIVRAIVSMARTLGIRVVAEGVETAEQARFLTREGCQSAQGYHFSRPMPTNEASDWLAGHASTRQRRTRKLQRAATGPGRKNKT